MPTAVTFNGLITVPGPRGATGAAGTNGSNGKDAFTTTPTGFTVPAVSANVNVEVADSTWMGVGQPIFVQFAGSGFEVVSKPDSTHVTLMNTGATDNVAPGTVIPATTLTPGGIPGLPGSLSGVAGGDLKGNYPNPQILIANAKGSLIVGNGTDSVALAAAADGTRPMYDSAQPTGMTAAKVDLADATQITNAPADMASATALAAHVADVANPHSVTRAQIGAAASGANADITSLTALTTPISKAHGGTGVSALPYFSVNRGNVNQAGVVTATPTKVQFNTEIVDSNSNYDTATYRFTPTKAGKYHFTVAITLTTAAAGGNRLRAHLYKNGSVVLTAIVVANDTGEWQAILSAGQVANGTTDYFEAFVEHDCGSDRIVAGDNSKSFFSAHWAG